MEKDVHAFVIRIWNEGSGGGKMKIWRGYIEHVSHDSRMYFSDLNGVVRFIKKQIDLQREEPASRWKAWFAWVSHVIAQTARKFHS